MTEDISISDQQIKDVANIAKLANIKDMVEVIVWNPSSQ